MIQKKYSNVQAIYNMERDIHVIKKVTHIFFSLIVGFLTAFILYLFLVNTASAEEYIYYDNLTATEITTSPTTVQDQQEPYSTGYNGWFPYKLEGFLINNNTETCNISGGFSTWPYSGGATPIQFSDTVEISFIEDVPYYVVLYWSESDYGIDDTAYYLESRTSFYDDCTGTIEIKKSTDTISYTTSGAGYDTISKFTIITSLGTINNPVVTILEPDQLDVIAQDVYNGSGSDAFFNMAISNVDSVVYSSLTPFWELEIYDEATHLDLICAMSANRGGTIDGSTNYGVQLNHKVDGMPDPCSNLVEGTYGIRARVTFSGFSTSDWSDWSDFTVGTADLVGGVTCSSSGNFFTDFGCWIKNASISAFIPSVNSIESLMNTVDDLGTQFPFSWVTGSYGAFTTALDQENDDLGTVDGGNPLLGEMPNIAWVAEQSKQFYGSWASGATAFFIWLSALISITRSGFRLLNIEIDDGLELS